MIRMQEESRHPDLISLDVLGLNQGRSKERDTGENRTAKSLVLARA